MIYIVMGVSGSGKSTVGERLAGVMNLPFYDADDFHSTENIEKMSQGTPLNDDDRHPWLTLVAEHIKDWEHEGGAVLACSALKQSYRNILSSTTSNAVKFIYLKGERALLAARLKARTEHFMPDALLTSQLETLEPPTNAITVSLEGTVDEIVTEIRQEIQQ